MSRVSAGSRRDPGPVVERRFKVRDGSLYGLDRGHGPLVLLLHGLTANAHIWDPLGKDLEVSFRVIALDQRGHGRSNAVSGDYDAAGYAEDIAEVLHSLGSQPALIVGHSLGARNGLEAAARRPELVAGVVAIDFVPYIEPGVFDSLDKRVEGGMRTFSSRAQVSAYLEERYPRLPPDAIERRALFGYETLTDGGIQPLADPEAVRRTCARLRSDLSQAVSGLEVPALLVRGADSALVSPRAFERTKRLRPDLDFLVVPGVDHYVPEERPHEVALAIRQFSAQLSGLGQIRDAAVSSEAGRAR